MRLSNITWNLFGLATPLVVAALTVPTVIEKIGTERFGLLTLAWGLIGYAGIFDLGIGRATTQLISRLRGSRQLEAVPAVLRTATKLSFSTGLSGMVLLSVAALLGVQSFIKHTAGLEPEITASMFMLAVAIPVQSISATYRGVNEAFENFRGVSLLRMALGVVNFLGPFCLAYFTSNLVWIVSTLLVSRLMALLVFRHLAIKCQRRNLGAVAAMPPAVELEDYSKRLLSFGGWFTVSSLISPILVQADRFFIAGIISAAAVAAYTIPYEVVVRSLIVVGAVSSVAFPSLTALIHSRPQEVQRTFRRWLLLTTGVMLAVTSLLAVLLPVIFPLWLGANLPDEAIQIGQILCIGVLANTVGSMYFALLHAQGQSDVTAKIHLLELPVYLIFLYWLINSIGVYGAAWAWVGRMLVDMFALIIACRRGRSPI